MIRTFRNTKDQEYTLPQIISEIKAFLSADTSAQYMLTIGTDSEVRRTQEIESLTLVTAVVIYRKGFGGKYFWTKTIDKKNKSLRDKIYQEVLLSLDVARELIPPLKQALTEHSALYDLEIHVDVGEVGATREMIREVVGLVAGMGYTARTKPYSYAASNIADRYN